MTFDSPAVVFPHLDGGFGVDIGADILSQFRVTIDYPRRRILLEPYDLPKQPAQSSK